MARTFRMMQLQAFIPDVKNIKSGVDYMTLSVVTDATNGTQGQQLVLYMDKEEKLWVRKIQEFKEKFTAIESN